ncbi:MAG: zinc metallopeptidase [Acidobacteriota bacterium]
MFDPMYLLLVALPTMVLSMGASALTKSTFKKYSRQRASTGLTGAEAAQRMLDRAGITDVKVVATRGYLSDHYNPINKTLALSEATYAQPTVAAIGVACHEAGHAIQHARSYAPLWVRSALVPVAGIGSNIGLYAMMIGLGFTWTGLVGLGALLFSAVVAFQLVTLPVEFDASARAKKLAYEYGLVSQHEREGVSKVLNAAAMTYVAAAASSILTLLYFLYRAGLLGGNRNN